jgi:uncharacterized protein YndB with AHSA1/START domain
MTRFDLPRCVADLTEGSILASVKLPAAPERVFAALTQANEILTWWGSPTLYVVDSWRAAFREGGEWSAHGHGADGAPFWVGGKYLRIEPPHLLVKTWQVDWDDMHLTGVSYELFASEAGTRLVVRHEGFADKVDDCQWHADGWEAILGWLRGYLEPAASGTFRLNGVKLVPASKKSSCSARLRAPTSL